MLRALEGEVRSLIIDYPVSAPNGLVDIPMNRWPPKIAGLKPEAVTVYRWGVDIMVKPALMAATAIRSRKIRRICQCQQNAIPNFAKAPFGTAPANQLRTTIFGRWIDLGKGGFADIG